MHAIITRDDGKVKSDLDYKEDFMSILENANDVEYLVDD